jgi:hypothetical protein
MNNCPTCGQTNETAVEVEKGLGSWDWCSVFGTMYDIYGSVAHRPDMIEYLLTFASKLNHEELPDVIAAFENCGLRSILTGGEDGMI